MIDGIQLLSVMATGAYMFIGVIVGFVAALFIIPAYCIGHPLVLAWWERYRLAVEIRKNTRRALNVLVEKMQEAELASMREVFSERLRTERATLADLRKQSTVQEKFEPPAPPPNEKFRKGA